MLFKELTELELVTGALVRGQSTHTPSENRHAWVEWKGIDCGGSPMLSYKPVSFTEGDSPSQGGLQYLLWVDVEACAMCQSILII